MKGPFPQRLRENMKMSMHDLTQNEVRDKFGVLNAIYWDREAFGEPALTKTPINNWRIIFSRVFGADLPTLADEPSLLMRDASHLYELRDVTDLFPDRQASDHVRIGVWTDAPDSE